MAREGYSIEKLLEITAENSDTNVQFLFGTSVPGGDTGEQDDAPIGSIYLKTDTFDLYQKKADADEAADWFNYASLYTILGVSEGDVDMGVFTGGILTDNTDVHTLLQELSDYIENIIEDNTSATGVTGVTVIDSEKVDDYSRVIWEVTLYDVADRSKQRSFRIAASHNGHSGADASTVDSSVTDKHAHGAGFNRTVSVDLSGTGTSQVMQLKLASTETLGIDVFATACCKVPAQG